MRAILLAAGFGTRLRPLTNSIPKCLVPIQGKPLLEIWLERLTEAGVTHFLINTHYLAEQVADFIAASRYREQVTLTYEKELLGTAGTLLANLDFLAGQDGLLIHVDNYCLADFRAFFQAHHQRPSGCLMTMMTFRADSPSSCGIVELDGRGVVIGFHEKVQSPPGDLANGAIYLLSGAMTSILAKEYGNVSDFSVEVVTRFVGHIFSYETQDVFIDIGTPETYALVTRSP
ncbi:MAG: nucleotidyltransferase family protein [Magnetococcales bacterium]|nr:nucleotidyltransferase family protein [Magnetococcales bacterium]